VVKMALETQMGELFKDETLDSMKILDSLLSPKNIDMKTHIISPLKFAILESVTINCKFLLAETKRKNLKLPMFEKVLTTLIKKIKLFLVSWDRMSRKEITETLQSIKQEGTETRSLFQKLIGSGK